MRRRQHRVVVDAAFTEQPTALAANTDKYSATGLESSAPTRRARGGCPTSQRNYRPDSVAYAASGPEGDGAAVPDYVRLLESGINVATTTVSRLIHPRSFGPEIWRNQLAEATASGGASLYASGIEPGFTADYLVLMLASQSKTIRSIKASEVALYDDYPAADTMTDGMGFGRPLDFVPMLAPLIPKSVGVTA